MTTHSQFGLLHRAALVGETFAPASFSGRHTPVHSRAEEAQAQHDADSIQRIVDWIGFIDPSGVADVLNMVGSLVRARKTQDSQRATHLRNAAMSAIGAIPFLGGVGMLGKSWREASLAAKAGEILPEAAEAASGASRIGRAGAAVGRYARQHPGTALTLAGFLAQSIKGMVGRRYSDQSRGQTYDAMVRQTADTIQQLRTPASEAQRVRQHAFNAFEWVSERPYTYRPASLMYGPSGRYDPSTPREYPPLRLMPEDEFAVRPRRPGMLRSMARGTGRGMRFVYDAYAEDSPAAWAMLGPRAAMHTAQAASAFGLRTAVGGVKTAYTVTARSGAMGPLAAHAAGGWYLSPSNVAATFKGFIEGLSKATAATIAWVGSLRLANMGSLAIQSRYAAYGGTMGVAWSRFQADEMRRDIRMAGTTGASYAALSRAHSKLEDRTLPYRAFATNVSNRFMQSVTAGTDWGMGVLENIIGLRRAVEAMNVILGGAGEERAPYNALLMEIAKGTFIKGPQQLPR